MKISLAVLIPVLLITGCLTPQKHYQKVREEARIMNLTPTNQPSHIAVAEKKETVSEPGIPPKEDAKPVAVPAVIIAESDAALASGTERLKALAVQMESLRKDIDAWEKQTGPKKGNYSSKDTDDIEYLLFKFLSCREALWDMIIQYSDQQNDFKGPTNQTKAFIIGFGAATLLNQSSAQFITTFIDDSKGIGKLNEAHYKYAIPDGCYDKIFDSLTSPGNISSIKEVRKQIEKDVANDKSVLSGILASEKVYDQLYKDASANYESGIKNIDLILKKRSIILPDVANLLRQNAITEKTRTITKDISDHLYVAQGLLFNNVSDIRRPMTVPADFNPDQVRLIKSLIKPGDLILTFTAGYMSNVFLPGKFKHGITYVGTVDQRKEIGLIPENLKDIPENKTAKLRQDLATGKLPSGYDADVIEAVAEGVIFNSLDYLLKTHINRVVILRPKISETERLNFLANIFLYLGNGYDFNFDFVDASFQCCTEVIYRSLNKKGTIDFQLVQRMAIQTLAADDIIDYHLNRNKAAFDVVLLAEEDPKSTHHSAMINIGNDAQIRLEKIMKEPPIELPKIEFKPVDFLQFKKK